MLRTFAGGRLFGALWGDGPPSVLALHGWGRSHADFDALARPSGAAGETLPAVALDLAGFGAAPAPEGAWGSADYAGHVSAVLEEMATPVVVVGHSFGGRVALHLAAAYPDAVGAMVLTGVPLLRLAPAPRPAASYRALRALHRMGLVGDARVDRVRQRRGSADYQATTGVMRDVFVRLVQETYEDQLDAVSCPVSMIWGEDDTTVPLEVARRALARLQARPEGPFCELVVCPGAGHLLPLRAPEALREVVDRRREGLA